MFSFFKKDKTKTLSYRRKMAERVGGQQIKYTTERKGDDDIVIGHGGALILREDEILVYASQDIVFRCDVKDLDISELMSKDGAILEGPDKTQNGAHRKVIAYYTYYLKRDL